MDHKLSLEKSWTKEEIVAVLKRESFGYQNVDLPFDLETGGVGRVGTAETAFGQMPPGKSVFDLGCRFGYFCFFAEERGAVDILGVDVDPENIRKARLLGEIRKSKARFETFNIERETIDGRFDYVLCLNVLHHLRNPLAAIDKLIAATREVLVLEVAGFSLRDRRHNHLYWPFAALLSRLPLFYVARRSSQTFFISLEAIKVLLLEKRADFARVEVVRGPKGRPIVFAYRRQIKKLLVVAGLPASGKSTLINHLQSSVGESLASEIGVEDVAEWKLLKFGELGKDREPVLGDVVVHYNISKHLIDGDIYLHDNALADLMSVANSVTIVTLAPPRKRLLEQFQKFRGYKANRMLSRKRTRKKIKRLSELIQNRVAMNELYSDWFHFVGKTGNKCYLITYDGAGYVLSQKQHLTDY